MKESKLARNGLACSEPYLWMNRYMMFNGRFVHQLVWEESNGKVPCGYILHHKNENRLDNRLENLELTTRAEHCKFHIPRLGYRAPVPKVCRLCGQERSKVAIENEPHRRICGRCRGRLQREKK